MEYMSGIDGFFLQQEAFTYDKILSSCTIIDYLLES